MNRRAFFRLLAAPAIIRVADLMPVRAIAQPYVWVPARVYTAALARRMELNRDLCRVMEERWLRDLIIYSGHGERREFDRFESEADSSQRVFHIHRGDD